MNRNSTTLIIAQLVKEHLAQKMLIDFIKPLIEQYDDLILEKICAIGDIKVIDTDTITNQEPVYSETETFVDECGEINRVINNYIESNDVCELIELSINNSSEKFVLLKMNNSLLNIHCECLVDSRCKTVNEAFKYTNQTAYKPNETIFKDFDNLLELIYQDNDLN